jgi:hypothetical protein
MMSHSQNIFLIQRLRCLKMRKRSRCQLALTLCYPISEEVPRLWRKFVGAGSSEARMGLRRGILRDGTSPLGPTSAKRNLSDKMHSQLHPAS